MTEVHPLGAATTQAAPPEGQSISPPAAMSGEGSAESPRWGSAAFDDALWSRIQELLQKRVAPEQFETWFRQARILTEGQEGQDARVVLAVLNGYSRDWIEKYYSTAVEGAVHSALEHKCPVVIAEDPEGTVPPSSARPSPANGANQALSPEQGVTQGAAKGSAPAPPHSQHPGGLLWNSDVILSPKYTFENFVVGPCNRFAHAAAVGSSERPGANYNPFFLHGRNGVGKTHLLQALCYSILERQPDARILYLSCETFVNHFISALENGDLDEFRNKYRSVDVLVVDDIHILANKERTQEEFFHTFNALYQSGKQLVFSSDSPPKEIPTLQARLTSRFEWGMTTEVEPPCFETRMAIVKRKSRDQGHELPDDVAQLIAEQIDENVRMLEGAVTRLLGFSSLTGKPVTIDLARKALGNLLVSSRGAPTMDTIVTAITEHFGVKLSELQSKRRTKTITFPRQIAMFLARKVTRQSLEEIGAFFGGRDHSTVIYAVDRIAEAMKEDKDTHQLVQSLFARLGGRAGDLD